MNAVFKKLTSRKFLAALAGVVMGISMAFGLDEGIITSVSGAVTALASVVAYIITEGKVDAAAVAAVPALPEAAATAKIEAEGGSEQ